MQRRSFLFFVKGLALGVGGATGSRWIVDHFDLENERADEPCAVERAPEEPMAAAGEDSEPELIEVVEQGGAEGAVAQGSARLRLILVIPSERDERWRRGRAFGEFLNHGGDEALARLALLEVSCATLTEVQAHTSAKIRREPWMILVDETVSPAKVTTIDPPGLDELAKVVSRKRGWIEDDEGGGGGIERTIDARIARLGEAIAAAIDAKTLERLAKIEAASLSGRAAEELKIVMGGPLEPRLEAVAAAPATLLLATLAGPAPARGEEAWMERHRDFLVAERKELFVPRLAELVRERLVRSRPPEGALWAYAGGCGVRVEGDLQPVAIGCGMGHVPERSRRFLSFLGDHSRGF